MEEKKRGRDMTGMTRLPACKCVTCGISLGDSSDTDLEPAVLRNNCKASETCKLHSLSVH